MGVQPKPTGPMCPVCWHEETTRARMSGREPCRDDAPSLRWVRPHGGARGQQFTRWDGGWWSCDSCEWREIPHVAGLMLDAVLMVSDPDCDSIGGEYGMHADARRALKGGE